MLLGTPFAMIWQFSPYALPLLAAVLAALVVVAVVWPRRHASGGATFILVALLTLPWTLGDALAHLSVPFAQKFLFNQVTYLSITTMPLLSLFFALEYTQQDHVITNAQRRILWILPVLTCVAALTDPVGFGIWTTVEETTVNGYKILVFGHGTLFWAYAAFGHFLNLVTTTIFISAVLRFPARARAQAFALFFSVIIPWLSNMAYLTHNNPIPGLDFTPLSFVVSFVIWGWVLLARQLFSIVPIARHLLIECMTDGVLVLDMRGRIVDNNPAALPLLNAPQNLIGNPLSQYFPQWETLKTPIPNTTPNGSSHSKQAREFGNEEIQDEVRVPNPVAAGGSDDSDTAAGSLSLDVRLLPLRDQRGDPSGQLVILRDVTERRRNMDAIQAANQSLQAQIKENRVLQARLGHLAMHDDLTGLLNRRVFQQSLEAQIAHNDAFGAPFVLMLLDLDGFKAVNDRHGHRGGDDVLRAFAQTLLQNRCTDETPFRYGGEEFAVLVSDCDMRRGLERAESYRAACAAMTIGEGAAFPIGMTCSIGVAAFPEQGRTSDALLSLADAALYRAKRNGRNRVCLAVPGATETVSDRNVLP